jgi:hypothetical protein
MSAKKRAARRRKGAPYLGDMDELRRQFDCGDKGAVLHAIFYCTQLSRPLPQWSADAFGNIYEATKFDYRHASWDEAFGPPHAERIKIGARRRQAEKEFGVWRRVTQLRKEIPRRSHFLEVAEEFGLSLAVAIKYFYAVQNRVHNLERSGSRSRGR